MIARLQRALLAAQLLVAALVALWLAATDRMAFGWALLPGFAVPIGVHVLVLTADFVLAWAARDPRPPRVAASRLHAIGCWVRAWAREIPDSLRTFDIAQPLLAGRPLPGSGRVCPTSGLPVLLIHGFFCNHALWRPMARALDAAGHPVAAVDLEPPFGPIDDYVPIIAEAVDALRRRCAAPQVAIVAHSMGGLAARAYLRACGDEAVAALITLGTPHRGTVHARLGHGHNVRQMRPDSDWLRQLATDEPEPRRARFTVILSLQDNIVAPQAIQTLPGARTIVLEGLGHVRLAYAPAVIAQVLATLRCPDLRSGSPASAAGTPPDRH